MRWHLLLVGLYFALQGPVEAKQAQKVVGYATWYSRASCAKEGTSGIMANGRALDDQAYTAASWDYPFGTTLTVCQAPVRVSRHQNPPCIRVKITDRGPSRHLYLQGRTLDLSKKSFAALADLSQGVIPVEITEIQ